ncbi:hypothetical protein [Shinella granuli]|uniref:hypothetical protein n=1 Tax=Shinella granuli TaxID=323621 RepID=UPI0013C31F95|nr:hypothetical protein [Shinella granuli]
MRLNRQSEIAIGILVACARSPMRKITTLQAAEASATIKGSCRPGGQSAGA